MVTHHYHSEALVESKKVGDLTRVGAFTRIYPAAEIGWGCNIADHCCIENRVKVGKAVIIGQGAYIPSGVTIEDHVRIGSHVKFFDETPYEARKGPEWPAHTLIGEGTHLAPGTTIRCGVTVGQRARTDPGSLVVQDVPDFARVAGSPARQTGWACTCGEPLDLPLEGDEQATCSCGLSYTMVAGRVAQDSAAES